MSSRSKKLSSRSKGGVSRVRFIEICMATAWMVEGELWLFRDGTEIAVGNANDLEASEPMVTAAVALGLINAGKAEAMAVTELDNADDPFSDDAPANKPLHNKSYYNKAPRVGDDPFSDDDNPFDDDDPFDDRH